MTIIMTIVTLGISFFSGYYLSTYLMRNTKFSGGTITLIIITVSITIGFVGGAIITLLLNVDMIFILFVFVIVSVNVLAAIINYWFY